MNCSEGDSLCPPIRIGAIAEKVVHQRVVEVDGTYQVLAKLGDRLRPMIGPQRASVVNRSLGSAADLLETQCRKPRRQGPANLVINPAFARPGKPPIPERPYIRRLGDADWEENDKDCGCRSRY